MAEKEIVDWFTMNGKHIPIYKGESKEDAINRSIAKNNEDKKAEQIAKNKAVADKLNGKPNFSNYLQENYGIKWSPSMNKLPIELQQSLVNQLDNAFKEFPQAIDKIKSIVVKKVDTDMGLYDGGAKDGQLVISDDFIHYDMSNPWKTNYFTVDAKHQLISHEIGHAVARAIGANSEWKTFKRGNINKSALLNLSKYAEEQGTDRELFAEAIADYLIHRNKAKAVSIQVANTAKSLLQK